MKRIMKLLIIILGLSPFLHSCESRRGEGDFIVEGRVINVGSREPIDSAKVVLRGGNPASNPFLPGFNDNPPSGNDDSTYTDIDGYFRLKVEDESFAYMGLYKKGYTLDEFIWYSDQALTKEAIGEGSTFSTPDNYYIIIEYKAECTFSPVLRKKGINLETDTLIVSITDYKHPSQFSNRNEYYGKSPFQVSRDYGYCTGHTYFHYKLEYTEDGLWKSKVDSVMISSFDTCNDTIYY